MIARTITLREGRQASPRAIEAATTKLPRGTYYLVAFYVEVGNGDQICYRWTACAAGLVEVLERLHTGTLGPALQDRIQCGMPGECVQWCRATGEATCAPYNGGVSEFAQKYALGL